MIQRNEDIKYLVLGAGISGISFVHFLNDNNYLILEKDGEIGGYCKTIKKSNYIWDYAGHFLHFKNQGMRHYINKLMKGKLLKINKKSKILFDDKLIDYPFQLNIHQLDKKDFIECLHSFYFKNNKKTSSNLKEEFINKFGKKICEKFMFPYNEKLYSCNLERMESNAIGRFLPDVKLEDIISRYDGKNNNSFYNDIFYYPPGGIIELVETLSQNIDKTKLRLNSPLQRLDIKNKVAYTNNSKINYEYLINTISLNDFQSYICNQTEKKLNKLPHNKILIFNFGFDKGTHFDLHWIYIPSKKYPFYRVGFYNNVLNEKLLSIYAEISFKQEDKIDIKKIRKKTMKGLKKIGIIKNHNLVSENNIVLDPAYVQLNSKDNLSICQLRQELTRHNIFLIGRYAEWTYSSMEDCILKAKRIATKIKKY